MGPFTSYKGGYNFYTVGRVKSRNHPPYIFGHLQGPQNPPTAFFRCFRTYEIYSQETHFWKTYPPPPPKKKKNSLQQVQWNIWFFYGKSWKCFRNPVPKTTLPQQNKEKKTQHDTSMDPICPLWCLPLVLQVGPGEDQFDSQTLTWHSTIRIGSFSGILINALVKSAYKMGSIQ